MSNSVSQLHSRDEIDSELELVDYVAGRLGEVESAAFEERLASDEALAARVEEERELRAALASRDTRDMPGVDAFERIAGKLRDEPQREARWQLPAIAAGIVAVIAVGFLMQEPIEDAPGRGEFETLSDDGAQPVEAGNRARIVFAVGTDADARAAVAQAFGFDIVSGPGPGGAFVVEAEHVLERHELVKWREDPRIELAEPLRYD